VIATAIVTLVRRDPATRTALWMAPVAGLSSLPLATMVSLGGSRRASTLAFVGLVLPWLVGLSMARVRLRGTELGLALPIPGPALVAARMAALALYVLLPALAALVVLALVTLVIAVPPAAAGAAVELVASVAAALLLTLLLVQRLAPGLGEVPAGRGLAGVALVGLTALATALLFPDLRLALLFFAAAAGLAAWTYRSVPPALEWISPDPPAPSGTASRATTWSGVDALVLRQLEWNLPLWLAIMLVWIVGDGAPGGMALVLVFPYAVSKEVARSLGRIAWADPLPISRRRLLAYVALPVLVATVGGAVAGDWLRSFSPSRPRVGFELDCPRRLGGAAGLVCHHQVRVPAERWRLAIGTPPTVSSPWGEQVAPPAHPLVWGAPVSIYNPFAVEEQSSRRFVALQMSRALRDVHERTIPPGEIARRYLRVDASGRVALVGDGLTAEEDYGLPMPPRRHRGPVLALVCALGWFASVAAGFRAAPDPKPRPPSIARLFSWVVIVAVLAAVLVFDQQLGEWISASLLAGLGRLLPSSAPAAAVVAVAIGGLLFLLLERLFARVELTPTAGETAGESSRRKLLGRPWLPVAVAPVIYLLFVLVVGLHAHASSGGVWGLRVLLLLGADANAVGESGEPPLHAAAYSGRSRAARLLLDHGARADVPGRDGRTALHLASWSDGSADRLGTFAALLDGGADANARDAAGQTPLMDAVHEQRTRALRLLVARGADLEARDRWGRTPLHRAVAERKTDSVRALLALGAHLDVTDGKGETARRTAERVGDPEILALLRASPGR
jgi:hypothetical protein